MRAFLSSVPAAAVWAVPFLGLAAAACADSSPTVQPQPEDPPGWEEGPAFPTPLGRPGGTVHRDRIWVAGGLTGPGQATDQVFVLSDDGTAWEPGPALPVAVGTTELVSVADTLFAVGARPLDPTGNPWTWALLEVEARWDERARLHDDRDDLVAVAHDGRVWVLGGDVSPADPPHRKGEAHGDSILVYDPATGAWAASGHTVRPRLQHSGVVDEGGRAWVFGGIRPGVRTSLDSVDVVALGAGAFGGPPPQPFGGPGAMAALVGGQIHLIGLWSPEIIEATHRRLDPASGTWTRLPDAPARMGLGKAVVWRDRIWIIGARRELPETTSDDVWIFDPAAPGGLTATRTRSAIMQRVEERTGGVMVLEPGACTDPARYGRRRPDRRDRRASGPEDDDP